MGMDAAETLHREPTYCHEDISVACKKMVSEIAEDLSLTDVRKLQYYFSLSKDLHETTTPLPTLALEVLESLEKKGKFSCYDIEPLEELLKSIQRCDLITKFIVNYKQRYSTGMVLLWLYGLHTPTNIIMPNQIRLGIMYIPTVVLIIPLTVFCLVVV